MCLFFVLIQVIYDLFYSMCSQSQHMRHDKQSVLDYIFCVNKPKSDVHEIGRDGPHDQILRPRHNRSILPEL